MGRRGPDSASRPAFVDCGQKGTVGELAVLGRVRSVISKKTARDERGMNLLFLQLVLDI
jgi:hypothetical protein